MSNLVDPRTLNPGQKFRVRLPYPEDQWTEVFTFVRWDEYSNEVIATDSLGETAVIPWLTAQEKAETSFSLDV